MQCYFCSIGTMAFTVQKREESQIAAKMQVAEIAVAAVAIVAMMMTMMYTHKKWKIALLVLPATVVLTQMEMEVAMAVEILAEHY